MKELQIIHNAGFFSCCSKRLEGVVWYFDTFHTLPDRVDSSSQFALYKANQNDDLTSLYFKDVVTDIPYLHSVTFTNDMQFLDYKDLDSSLKPFIKKYFSPSDHVLAILSGYEKKYSIDYQNTCGVFYRGNDKATETSIAAYDSFIVQAKKIKELNQEIIFIVQSDETEFIDAFKESFPGAIVIEEVPHMHKKQSAIHDELPQQDRAEFGANFFAALLVMSKCQYLITHSGNCGLWAVLYRGNPEQVYQWLNNSWHRSRAERVLVGLKIWYKKVIKNMLGKNKLFFKLNEY
jgi:hypothetical protein